VFKLFDLDVIKYKIIIKHWVEDRLRIKIGPNYEANKIRGGYDWSGDFDVKKVITTGEIITPTITP
jgi:hypothetical protein